MGKRTRVALIALGVIFILAAVYYTLVVFLLQGIRREEKERAAVLSLESDRIKASPVERADETLKPAAGFGR